MPRGGRRSSQVQKAKEALVKLLADEPGFVGVGVSVGTSGEQEIVVLVTEATSPVVAKVPNTWKGIPVRTQIGGPPKKF